MKVVEIFKSIDGEGKRAGELATFIRLAGCNILCSYCDSMYAHDVHSKDVFDMTVDEIIEKCFELNCPNITLTGGEPLVHPHVATLIAELSKTNKFDINVETNGTIDPSRYHGCKNVWFTIDYKCPSSGCSSMMNPRAFKSIREKDVLKFVVGNETDLKVSLSVLETYHPKSSVYFSPVFGYDPKNIVNFMIDNELNYCKVQLQLHKYIWNPDERGV